MSNYQEQSIEETFIQAQHYLTSTVKRKTLYSFIKKHPDLILYEHPSYGSLLNVATRWSYFDDIQYFVQLGFKVNATIIQSSVLGYYYNQIIYGENYPSVTKLKLVKDFLTPFMPLNELKIAKKDLVQFKKEWKHDKDYMTAIKEANLFFSENINVLTELKKLEQCVNVPLQKEKIKLINKI